MSGVFVNVNRGKRSIVLDLRTDAGKTALRALIETADVFIHSMRVQGDRQARLRLRRRRRDQPGDRLHQLLRLRPARTRPRPARLRRHHPGRMRSAGRAAAADRRGELRRHDHGRQGRRPDGAVRDDDGVVPPRADRRGPRGRGRHVRDDGVVHARRTRQRRHVRPSARPGGLSAHRGAEPAAVPHQRRLHRRADLQRQALERLRRTRCGRRGPASCTPRWSSERTQIDTRLRSGGRDDAGAHHRGMAGAVPRTRRSPRRR